VVGVAGWRIVEVVRVVRMVECVHRCKTVEVELDKIFVVEKVDKIVGGSHCERSLEIGVAVGVQRFRLGENFRVKQHGL
jgi:pyrroloquinoline quinone (PQQ) biosynthesis protein C